MTAPLAVSIIAGLAVTLYLLFCPGKDHDD